MFKNLIKGNKKETKQKLLDSPKFYSFLSDNPTKETLKERWIDNNYQIPHFNTWEELYSFFKDGTKPLAAKLEIISNLDCNIEMFKDAKPIPDYFWQDTTLDRKIRAYCRINSKAYMSIHLSNSSDNDEEYYEKFIHNLDEELFLGLCELQIGISGLLENEKVTMEQKELIIRNAIDFKQSLTRQADSHEYILLHALDCDSFSQELKSEIYMAAKENMIKTKHYANGIFETFFNQFYRDETISKEDKIKIIKTALPDAKGYDYSKQYLFYLGNKHIPSYIQKIVLEHFTSTVGYNLEHSHRTTLNNIDSSSFISILTSSDIPLDLKSKLINATPNPVMICQIMMSEELEEPVAELLKVKLETMKIPETKEILEIIRTLLNNPEVAQKRLRL